MRDVVIKALGEAGIFYQEIQAAPIRRKRIPHFTTKDDIERKLLHFPLWSDRYEMVATAIMDFP